MGNNEIILVGGGRNCGLSYARNIVSLGESVVIHKTTAQGMTETMIDRYYDFIFDRFIHSERNRDFNKHIESLKEKSKSTMFITNSGRG